MDDCPEKPAPPAHARDRALLNKLSDGLVQLGAAEESRGAAERNVISAAKEKEPTLSQDGWLFFFVPVAAEAVSALKEAG
jgi:hypothetical protein